MDPFRTQIEPSREPPPPIEEASYPEEPSAMDFVRLYRRKWLSTTLLAWLLMMVLSMPAWWVLLMWGFTEAAEWSWLVALVVETIHGLIYLSPLLGAGSARDAVREASWGADVGGWIVSAARLRWPTWAIPVSSVGTSVVAYLAGELMGSPGTSWDFVVVARLLYVAVWLASCFWAAEHVGVLRWTLEDGRRSLVLQTLEGFRSVQVEALDLEAQEITLAETNLEEGVTLRRWQGVSSLEKLARDVKKSALSGM